MALARADLESLLRARRLDRTLTSTLPAIDPTDEYASGATGITRLDTRLGGGLPRGQLSEITGARSSGRTSLAVQLMAAATARGELVALVDALDMFDVESAAAAGVDLSRVLWIRGHVVTHPGLCRDLNQRALEQAIRALTLVLGAGLFGLVVFDVAEAPGEALRRLPFTTWLRLQRMVEGRHTICVLVGAEPVARSSAGLTVQLKRERLRPCESEDTEIRGRASASARAGGGAPAPLEERARLRPCESEDGAPSLFSGINFTLRIVRARARGRDDTTVALATRVASYA